ncbi:MAG: hypothetical protein ACI9CF_000672 [Candidatus Omnitrophota bacterium]|jgi:hypothetical protein
MNLMNDEVLDGGSSVMHIVGLVEFVFLAMVVLIFNEFTAMCFGRVKAIVRHKLYIPQLVTRSIDLAITVVRPTKITLSAPYFLPHTPRLMPRV